MFGKLAGWFAALSTIGKVGVVTAASVGTLAVVTAPANNPPPPAEPPPQVQGDKIEKKTDTKTEAIPFETKTVDDPTSPSGTEKVTTEGVNGVKTLTYDVTLTNGVETDRQLVKEEITTPPVTKVIAQGTYTPPPPPPPPPPPAPAYRVGAVCADGWDSTATGRGACSHHGGVSCWKYSDGSCRSN